ncbi:MAG TPA: hypothetical protein VGH76_22285 [Actinomycetospora sp.]|uniref:endonuclease domain-containing protein n=1 Tax=Actinomycetospora sp. TaxID=1872135 RepID=UPI002F3F4AA1
MAIKEWPTDRPFRASEAVRAGLVTWRVLQGPGFRRLAHDTYVAAAVEDSDGLVIRAAVVWGGPTAVVTGWSACRWWGCEVLPRPEPPVELVVAERRQSPPPGWLVRRGRLRNEDVVSHEDLRLTTPLRTAYDLARLAPRDDAVVAGDALARTGGFIGTELERFAVALGTMRGCRRVPAVARLVDPRAESPMETRVRLDVVRAGFPPPVSQHEVWDGPWFVARLDLAWPEWKVALEYDGHDHAADDRRGRDVERIDELRGLGWVVITVTARQYFHTPRWIERRVREELTARGARL